MPIMIQSGAPSMILYIIPNSESLGSYPALLWHAEMIPGQLSALATHGCNVAGMPLDLVDSLRLGIFLPSPPLIVPSRRPWQRHRSQTELKRKNKESANQL